LTWRSPESTRRFTCPIARGPHGGPTLSSSDFSEKELTIVLRQAEQAEEEEEFEKRGR
jgi:hypothetical protein